VAVKTDTSSLDFFLGVVSSIALVHQNDWHFLSSPVYGCVMFKGLFLLPLLGYLTMPVFLPLS